MSRRPADRFAGALAFAGAVVAGAVLVLVVAYVAYEVWPALRDMGPVRFVTDPAWYPTSGEFNLVPMLLATLATAGLAIAVAGPVGVVSGVFSVFYAPGWVAAVYRRVVELLSGIPSVVYGLWGLVVLVPVVAKLGGSGTSLLAAALILALMILPTVALTAEAALAAVPAEYLRGAAALGLRRGAVAWRVALPAARSGIAAGVVLAVARALGETIAVVMVAGNVVNVPTSLLEPVRTLTATIALEMGYATEAHRGVLFVCGLGLIAAVGTLALVAMRWRQRDPA